MNITPPINETSDFNLANITFSRSFLTGWFTLTISISIVTSALCVLLLASIVSTQKWRKGATVLIVHLLCLDLFACAITFPGVTIDIFLIFTGHTLYSLCPLDIFLPFAIWYVNCWSTALLAFNRFIAILFPSFYRFLITKHALLLTILASWLIGVSSHLPALFSVGARITLRPSINVCSQIIFYDRAWYAMVSMGLAAPVVLEGIAYLVLFVVLASRPDVVEAKVTGDRQRKRIHRKIKVAKMLCLSYLSCLVCYAVVPLLTGWFTPTTVSDTLELNLIPITLEVLGYMIAPMVYLALNAEYRRGARNLLLRCLRGSRVRHGETELFTVFPNDTVDGTGPTTKTTTAFRADPDTL